MERSTGQKKRSLDDLTIQFGHTVPDRYSPMQSELIAQLTKPRTYTPSTKPWVHSTLTLYGLKLPDLVLVHCSFPSCEKFNSQL